MTDLEYLILSGDNIDEAVELTGKTKEVLKVLLDDSINYGHHMVLWKEFDTWFGIRISSEFVNDGELASVVKQILRRPH